MLRHRTAVLCLFACWLPAQTAPSGEITIAGGVADALQRGDRGAARALAASEPDLARRSLLDAALVPLAQRPAAMLAVAQRFPEHAVAGSALQAGFASVLMLQGRAGAEFPEVAELFDALGDEVPRPWPHDPILAAELGAVVPLLLGQHRLWQAEHGEPEAAELRLLAMLAAHQRVLLDPVPVESWTDWPLPRGLVEDLLISIRPVGDAAPASRDALAILGREPTTRWLLAAKDTPPHLASPPPGRWLLEVQSLQTPWRSLRVLDVGAAMATCVVDEGVFAWSLSGNDLHYERPTKWSMWRDGRCGGTTNGELCGVWPLGPKDVGSLVAQARNGDIRTRVAIDVPVPRDRGQVRHVAHWQFDRPLHRPGEVLHGRAIVRHVSWTGVGLAAVPATQPFANRALQLRGKWPNGEDWSRDVATDARGMVVFSVPIPAATAPGDVLVALTEARPSGDPVGVVSSHATTIANFRRPAMVASIDGPARVAATDGAATVNVRVQWASGGGAAGVPVSVVVRSYDDHESRRLTTGGDGRLAIPITIAGVARGRVFCECTVEGADGFAEHLEHTIDVEEPPTPVAPPSPREAAPPAPAFAVELPAEVVVGATIVVAVRGAPYTHVLGVVGRGTLARAESFQLDSNGTEEWQVVVTSADWPRLDVVVVAEGTGERESAHTFVRRRPAVPVRIDVPPTARPKERVQCRVTAAPNATITVAVVDDRVFRMCADPTQLPDLSLRPDVAWPNWRVARSAEPLDPRRIFGELFVAGRVPGASDWQREVRPTAGSGGPSGPSSGAVAPRTDFRATVCFVTTTADAQGNADVPIELPDDVTTWRCTATAVDADGEGGLARATITARLPLVAEPLLPRVLRRGDHVRMPLVLDRDTNALGPGRVEFTVTGTNGVLVGADGTGTRHVAAGTAATVSCALRGDVVGTGQLAFAAAAGAFADRSERPLPVLADTVVQPIVASAAGKAAVAVVAPIGRDANAPQQLIVMAGGAAAWRQLAERLQAYPYGCVEQTLSRLLPFAAVNLGRARQPIAAHADRIGAGMARLRQLQVARGGAFAWWPKQAADFGMTGLVLHGLAALRAGGVDPMAYGIEFDIEGLRASWRLAAAEPAATATAAADRADAVELLSGLLRLHPAHGELRAAAGAVADAVTPLPRGCVLRLGLALASAGDAERARRLLHGDAAAATAALPRAWFPGEDATVVAAQAIELRRAVAEPVAVADEVALLRELLAGDCRTYTDGAALVALAPLLASEAAELTFEVVVDDAAPIAMRLQPDHAGAKDQGAQFVLPLASGSARRCTVRCTDPEQLLFVAWTASTTRPGVGAAWAEPFVVERQLRRLSKNGQWQTLQGDVVVGERLRVDVRLSAPAERYVAVVCPLPAGFEVVGDDDGVQRFDDRVVTTFARVYSGAPQHFTFDVVATLPGDVLWPPAMASAMYDSAAHGGSDGRRLTIVPAATDVAAPVAPFLQPSLVAVALSPRPVVQLPRVTDEVPPLPSQLASDAWHEIEQVWITGIEGRLYGFDDEPDAEAKARVDAALANLFAVVETDETAVAAGLDDDALVTPGAQLGGALSPWRAQLLRRIDDLRRVCLDRGVARCERALASSNEVDTWTDVMRHAPDAEREGAALRLLRAMWPLRRGSSESVLVQLAAPVRDPGLVAFAATMLATADSDVLDELVRLLPEERWSALPATTLVDAAARSGAQTTARLLRAAERTPAGLLELRRRALDPAWLAELDTSELGDDLLVRMPVAALADLAADEPERAARLLAAGELPTRELWRFVLERDATLPLPVVVTALQRRGPIELPAGVDADAIADPTVRTIVAALLAKGAPSLLPKALAAAQARGDGNDAGVDDLVGGVLAEQGSAEQVAEFASWLTAAQWATVWARLDVSGQRLVLAKTTARLEYGPPADDAVLIAMLVRAEEWRDVDDAVAAVLRSPGGEERLRAVLPTLAPALAAQVQAELADRLDVDAVIAFAALRGWTRDWPAHLVVVRDRFLGLRGLR